MSCRMKEVPARQPSNVARVPERRPAELPVENRTEVQPNEASPFWSGTTEEYAREPQSE